MTINKLIMCIKRNHTWPGITCKNETDQQMKDQKCGLEQKRCGSGDCDRVV